MLPQELYNLIVDYCHDNRQALGACSLASRALNSASRRHIFRSILIDSGRILERFRQLLHTSPDVAHLIEELSFKSYDHFMRKDPYLWICNTTSFPPGTFRRLRVIGFSHVRFNELNVSARDFMTAFYKNLSNYRGVRELRLTSCDFEHLDVLKVFICGVAPQGTGDQQLLPFALSLHSIDFQVENVSGPPRLTAPGSFTLPRLTSFTGGINARSDCIVSWLINTPSFRTLRNVTLSNVLGSQIIAVGDLLRHVGDALVELQLGIRLDCARGYVQEVQRIFDLSRNTRLQSLHLRILDYLSDYYLIRWVNALLVQTTRLPLQKVIFEVWLHDPRQLRFPVWDDIEATLSSVPFATVSNVLFIHNGDLYFAEARNAVEKRFPELVWKRRLTVRDCSTRWISTTPAVDTAYKYTF